MTNLSRRGILGGLAGMLAVGIAPAIIRTPGLIMPIKALPPNLSSGDFLALIRSDLQRLTGLRTEVCEFDYGNQLGAGVIFPTADGITLRHGMRGLMPARRDRNEARAFALAASRGINRWAEVNSIQVAA